MNINRRYERQYNPKRIRRLMHLAGLKSDIRRANGYCTQTSYVNIEANILGGDFTAAQPNQKWVTDVTHLKYGFGQKAYLSAIKDLYDGAIVAYQVSRSNDNPLVMDTIRAATDKHPDASPLIHSDRAASTLPKNTGTSRQKPV